MIWLAIHMWMLLFASFGIGLAVGWWIWGVSTSKSVPEKSEQPSLGTLEADAPLCAE